MRLIAACLLALCLAGPACAQEIPAGVNYKRTSDAINKQAADLISKLLSAEPDKAVTTDISSQVLVCGPGAWSMIRSSAPEDLQKATLMNLYVPTPSGTQKLIGRAFKSDVQKRDFWKLFLNLYGGQKNPVIRKANTAELNYYWAIIPYDIEEPLFIAVVNERSLLFHFTIEDGKPRIFDVDVCPVAS